MPLDEQSQYKPTVSVKTRLVGDGIEIRVMDNADGIPKDVLDKIFQPFFTTKPTGEGTGLGLSLSYDIVSKGHGGALEVQSEVRKGTEFIVKLPEA
jgi:signal transduction histidine kinase